MGLIVESLNRKTKDFDFELWKEQDSSCLLCHNLLSLDSGAEWPEDHRLLLCWGCMSELCAELLMEGCR